VTTPAAPEAPASAVALFGPERVGLARRYAALLADAGVVRGLIGPREVPVLWPRHLENCALLAELIPGDARVVDVGSGAGLPGVVLAICRPDIIVDLVEPLERRCIFLSEAVAALGLGDQVRVVRARAEDRGTVVDVGGADVVTARAVAPLSRLVRWCLPLVKPGGSLLALKGARAAEELEVVMPELARLGGLAGRIVVLGEGPDVTRVVVIDRSARSTGQRRERTP